MVTSAKLPAEVRTSELYPDIKLERVSLFSRFYRIQDSIAGDIVLEWAQWVSLAQAILQADVRHRRELYIAEEERDAKSSVPCPPSCPPETSGDRA